MKLPRGLGSALASAVVCAVFLLVPLAVPTTQRPIPGQVIALADGSTIFVRDASIDRVAVEPNTVPTTALYFILVPESLLLIAAGVWLPPRWGGRSELWPLVSASLIGSSLTRFVTECGKNYAGFLRPNFYSGCGFNDTLRACTQAYDDGRHSFPSGHMSSSMAVAVLFCIYLLRASRLLARARCDASYAAAEPEPESGGTTGIEVAVPGPGGPDNGGEEAYAHR